MYITMYLMLMLSVVTQFDTTAERWVHSRNKMQQLFINTFFITSKINSVAYYINANQTLNYDEAGHEKAAS